MRPYFTLMLCLGILVAASQEAPKIKYGKISPSDFEKKVYAIDSNASAVVLSDIGETEIKGNSKGWFSLEYKRHKRVHILKKPGYSEADVEIALYTSGNGEEELDNLKAVTYNLENGKVVESKLEKANVFKEKRSKNWMVKKFTLPNVKEGAIIEFEYKIVSDFLFNLRSWAFQGPSPRLWSEYRVSIPEFFYYVPFAKGYQPFLIKGKKDRNENYIVRDTRTAERSEEFRFTASVSDFRWAMKDVPELKRENYTSSLDNHIAKIEFQLAEYRRPLQYQRVMGDWGTVTKELLKDEDFGAALDNNNNWLSDVVKPIIQNAGTDIEKAKQIYAYVRDNFTCTDHEQVFMQQPLKNVLKTKNGGVAEINLLLTAMLRYAGMKADPVMLSTRDNGYPNTVYPLLSEYNYVVIQVEAGNQTYYLDASYPRLGFGKLNYDCYNGPARIIKPDAAMVDMQSDLLMERKVTSMIIINDEKGKWVGSGSQLNGYFESIDIRDRIKDKGQEEFFKEIQKGFTIPIKFESTAIDSLKTYEEPVTIRYNFALETPTDDIIYVNPMFGQGQKENPFKSAERRYPVEMPFKIDETYILTMDVPEGYVVDELPKQIALKLDEEDSGMFEYRIVQSENKISLRTRIKLNRTNFVPEGYEVLREFFNIVVSKQNEQIVFKKKK